MAILDKIVRASQLEPKQQLINVSVVQRDVSTGDLLLDEPTGIINVDDAKYVTKVVLDETTGLLATKAELTNKLDTGGYSGTAQELKTEIDEKLNSSDIPPNLPLDLFRDGGYIGTAQSLKDEIDMKANVSSIPTDIVPTGGYAGTGQDLKNEIDSKITIDQVPTLPTDLMKTGGYVGTGQDLKTEIDSKISIGQVPPLPTDLMKTGGYIGTGQDLKDELDTKISIDQVPTLPVDLMRTGGYVGTGQDLKDELDTKITIAEIPELPSDLFRDGGYIGTAQTLKDEIDTKITISDVPELPTDLVRSGGYVGTANDLKSEIETNYNKQNEAILNNTGKSIGFNGVTYIQDDGEKVVGYLYYDKNSDGLFKCIKSGNINYNSSEYFENDSNYALSDKLKNLETETSFTDYVHNLRVTKDGNIVTCSIDSSTSLNGKTNGYTLYSLPSEYRPKRLLYWSVSTPTGNPVSIPIWINTDGRMTITGLNTTINIGAYYGTITYSV